MRRRNILFAGFVARVEEERLPKRVMFGEMVGGKVHSFGQEKDRMGRLEEGVKESGIKSEGWCKAAQKAGTWFGRVEAGAEAFMRTWHDAERSRAAEQHGTVANAARTVQHQCVRGLTLRFSSTPEFLRPVL